MTFLPDEDIDAAFSKLSLSVTSTIENTHFFALRRACIKRTNSPKMFQKLYELYSINNAARLFQALCTMLAKSPYWNFLDIRMMEAIAAASLIPAVQESVENFKRTFFGMSLFDVAPYFPLIPMKSSHIAIIEELAEELSKITLFELYKHRFYLETELIQTGLNTCIYTKCNIATGTVKITWQIHVDHVYKAYCSWKEKQSQSSQKHMTISFKDIGMYEGLPLVWRGEEIKQYGPIEPLSPIQQTPVNLLGGLQWVPYDFPKVVKDLHLPLSKEFMQWVDCHPLSPTVKNMISSYLENKWFFAINYEEENQLIGCMKWYFLYARVGGKTLKLFHVLFRVNATHEVGNLMFKELFRRVKLYGISQGLMYSTIDTILKPVTTVTSWTYIFHGENLPLPHSPKTPGWRAMTSKDILSALTLTNKYTSQFEIGRIFQSEEEFSYCFMCPMIENYMQTYVVEDPVTHDITDVVGYKLDKSKDSITVAFCTILIAAKSPPRQLLIDILVCARQAMADMFNTLQFGLGRDVFENLFNYGKRVHWHLLNYQYNEINENQVCLFTY